MAYNTEHLLRVGDAKTIYDSIQADITETVDNLLDYSMVDRLDPSEAEVGKAVKPSTGAVVDNSAYFTTGYMPIRPGETLRFYRRDTKAAITARNIAGYDANKTFVPNSGEENAYSVTQTGNIAYYRVSFAYNTDYFNQTPTGVFVVPSANPTYAPGTANSEKIDSKYLRKTVNIYASDTEAEILTKLVDAYNTGYCDVYFERADYTFGAKLATIQQDYGLRMNEIPVGNNCRYYFNGAVLTATLDLTEYGTDYYANFFGTQRTPSSFEMHDGVLNATDTRYVVHDESNGYPGAYRHLYQNMELHYTTDDREESIRKALGGGTGYDGVVEIVGCVITTDGTSECASFHGGNNSVEGGKFDVSIRNSYLSNGFRLNEMATGQTARLFYVGNSAVTAPVTTEGVTVVAFGNELRT